MHKTTQLSEILALCAGLFFALLYLTLGYFNRFTSDDIGILYTIDKIGIIANCVDFYLSWDGRIVSMFLATTFMKMSRGMDNLLHLQCTILIGMTSCFYFLLRAVFKTLLVPNIISPIKLLASSCLLCIAFFYLTFEIGEVWFWMMGTGYVWSLSFLLLGVSFLIRPFPIKRPDLLMASLFFFLFGFQTVSYVALTLSICVIIVIRFLVYKGWSWGNFAQLKSYSIPLFFFLLGFLIMAVAPGNYHRREYFEPDTNLVSITEEVIMSLKHFGKVILYEKLGYMLLFFISSCFIARFVPSKLLTLKELVIQLIWIGLIVIVALFAHSVSMSIATGWIGQPRIWTLISLVLAFSCVASGFYVGVFLKINFPKISNMVTVLGLLGVIALNIFTFINEYPIAKRYGNAVDNRLDLVRKLNTEHKWADAIVELKPLPNSGIIFSLDLFSDTANVHNILYKKINKLHFSVIVPENHE